jgi:spore germination protein GerM
VTGRRLVVAVATALLGLAGCGVPTSGEPETIPASDVPYGLASPTPAEPSDPSVQTMIAETGIYLVTAEDVLVARGRELPPGSVEEQLEALLGQLAAGPSEQERADELSTALPPEVGLHVTGIEDGTATIDIAGPVDAPSGADSRLAVAQIVLTATSVPDVQAVRLTRGGDPVDAPLPDGELTSEPLTADEFAAVLTAPAPSPTSSPRATPTPTPTPSPPS